MQKCLSAGYFSQAWTPEQLPEGCHLLLVKALA